MTEFRRFTSEFSGKPLNWSNVKPRNIFNEWFQNFNSKRSPTSERIHIEMEEVGTGNWTNRSDVFQFKKDTSSSQARDSTMFWSLGPSLPTLLWSCLELTWEGRKRMGSISPTFARWDSWDVSISIKPCLDLSCWTDDDGCSDDEVFVFLRSGPTSSPLDSHSHSEQCLPR